MRVACHQPYFLPALSFFAKWAAADCLILLDELQFVRKSAHFHYANRCKLGDGKWYTVPMVQVFPQMICEVKIVDGWSPKSLVDRIRNDYRDARHVREVAFDIQARLAGWAEPSLIELNCRLLVWAAERLGIDKPVYLGSSLGIGLEPDRDVRLSKLVKAVGGDVYVAGTSGPAYMNPTVYREAGLRVEICRYEPIPYDRGARSWIPYMSVMDACCYVGEDARKCLTTKLDGWLDCVGGS